MRKNVNRRYFLRAMGIGSAALTLQGLSCGTNRPAREKQPNIIFIMADDLGSEWLSCYGGEEIKTPNLDKLAEGGMQFNNAYSMPQCTPTRASLLTGQYPFRHGWINHWDMPRLGAGCNFDWKHDMTFARLMKTAGYVTAAAGKWQFNDFRVQPDAAVQHGFDEYCMWTGGEAGNPISDHRYWDPYIHTKKGSMTYKNRFGTDVFMDFLIDFMHRHKEKPMMLYFPMCLTHSPYTSTPLEPGTEGDKERFKAMVRYVDYTIGRLVKALNDLKIRDNTIIIFTTDNGTGGAITGRMNGRIIRGGKATLGESGVREPFIVNCPNLVPSGVVTDALTDITDMLPTFAELGGIDLPDEYVVDGCSIAPLILGKADDSRREWIMAMGHGLARLTENGVEPVQEFTDRVVRDKQYKMWVLDGKSAKLFDLIADPAETNNLIDCTDANVADARKRLEAVWKSFPKKDGKPRYDPTPPQPWDVSIEEINARIRKSKKVKK